MKRPRFVVYPRKGAKGSANRYAFRLIGANGRTMAEGRGFRDSTDAARACRTIASVAPLSRIEVVTPRRRVLPSGA